MEKQILADKILKKIENIEEARVTQIYHTPVNMIWLELEKAGLHFQLIIDGLCLIEKDREIVLINQDFYQENEKDFKYRLSNTLKSISVNIKQLKEVNIEKNWSYVELILNNQYVLLAKPNRFGFIGINDLQENQAYSVIINYSHSFIKEPLS